MLLPILFARITWMRWYAGPQLDEIPCSASLQETENFKTIDGRVFGFAQPVTNGKYPPTVKLERIMPGCGGDVLTGVTVVFVATARSDGQRVVGWYRHALVHRMVQRSPLRDHEYYFETDEQNAVLIPDEERTCRVPAGQGAFGKSNLWYIFEKTGRVKPASWTHAVLNYINTRKECAVVRAQFAPSRAGATE
jgi:hypothetical protein